MKYKVEGRVERKKEVWVVVDENGRVANGFKHKEKGEAEKHCLALNSFFGDK